MISKLFAVLFLIAGAGSVVYGASFINSPRLTAGPDATVAGTMLVAGGLFWAIGWAFVVFPRERRK